MKFLYIVVNKGKPRSWSGFYTVVPARRMCSDASPDILPFTLKIFLIPKGECRGGHPTVFH